MRNLPWCFKFFTWCGFWRPLNASPSMKFFYNVYSAFSLLVLSTLMIFQILDIIINVDNMDDLMDSSFLLFELIASIFKAINVMMNREKFLKVMNMLQEDFCQCSGDAEQLIQDKFNRMDRGNRQTYATVVTLSVICFIVVVCFNNEGALPIRVWLPYNISSLTLYWLSFLHQIIGVNISAVTAMAYDVFISGLFIQICAQLEILKHRFLKFAKTEYPDDPNDVCREELLKNYIRHHCHIIKFASTVEKDFNLVIFLQCSVSVGIVCSSLFLLLTIKVLSIRFMSVTLYLANMLFQLFVYCWYGNEVILKSTEIKDAIFQMNWVFLKNSTKKALIVVMMRSQRAIKFTSGYVVTLSLESYVAILKASYSVYNILQ